MYILQLDLREIPLIRGNQETIKSILSSILHNKEFVAPLVTFFVGFLSYFHNNSVPFILEKGITPSVLCEVIERSHERKMTALTENLTN